MSNGVFRVTLGRNVGSKSGVSGGFQPQSQPHRLTSGRTVVSCLSFLGACNAIKVRDAGHAGHVLGWGEWRIPWGFDSGLKIGVEFGERVAIAIFGGVGRSLIQAAGFRVEGR